MYAACSFAVGQAAHAHAITSFARVWVWIALVVWLIVFAGMLRGGGHVLRGKHPPVDPPDIAALVADTAPCERCSRDRVVYPDTRRPVQGAVTSNYDEI